MISRAHTDICHCVDANKIELIVGVKISKVKDTRHRKGCGCTKNQDIGGYNKEWECHHSCLYCYANPNNRKYGKVV